MKQKRKEHAMPTEFSANTLRKAIQSSGARVSVVSYNPNSKMYVFDSYHRVKDENDG